MPGFFSNFPLRYYDVEGDGSYFLAVDLMRRFQIRDEVKYNVEAYFMYSVQDTDTPEILADQIYGDPDHWWIIMAMNDIVNPNFDWPLSQAKLLSVIEAKYPGEAHFVWSVANQKNFLRNETVSDSNGNTRTVARWSPTYRRLEVSDGIGFELETTITGATSGCTATLKRKVLENSVALHHFTTNGNTSTSATVLDPWDSANSYLSNYINSSVDTNVVTNFDYESAVNEDKRNIRILHPRHLGAVLKDAETVLQQITPRTTAFLTGE